MDQRILVVAESELVCQQLSQLLQRPDRHIVLAHDGTTALEWLVERPVALVVAEVELADIDGLELLRELHVRAIPTNLVLMTDAHGLSQALAALPLGAYDYLTKPIDPNRLELVVHQALQDRHIANAVARLAARDREQHAIEQLRAERPTLWSCASALQRLAGTDSPLLLTGAPSPLASRVVRALHRDDPRSSQLQRVDGRSPFALELFRDLVADRETGVDDRPDNEALTIWIESIDGLPPPAQVAVHVFLESQRAMTDRERAETFMSVRLIATTPRSLPEILKDERIHKELLDQFEGGTAEVQASAGQGTSPDDLIDSVLPALQAEGQVEKILSPAAREYLALRAEPLGPFELKAILRAAACLATGDTIEPEHFACLSEFRGDAQADLTFDVERPLKDISSDILDRVERAYLTLLLDANQGRVDRCANQAKLSRRSISAKLRRYGIDKSDFKARPRRSQPRP